MCLLRGGVGRYETSEGRKIGFFFGGEGLVWSRCFRSVFGDAQHKGGFCCCTSWLQRGVAALNAMSAMVVFCPFLTPPPLSSTSCFPRTRSFAHSADAVMVLAYGIIMLNTDRHSPMVRNKMDLRAFKRNLEGTNTDEKGPPALRFLPLSLERII